MQGSAGLSANVSARPLAATDGSEGPVLVQAAVHPSQHLGFAASPVSGRSEYELETASDDQKADQRQETQNVENYFH